MLKFTLILSAVLLCSPKLSILKFQEQLEYPGIQNGTTHVNYHIEIDNPKKKTIEIESVWARGKKLKFTQTASSDNPIKINVFDEWQNPAVDSTASPTGNSAHKGAIVYHVKGKKKKRTLGIEIIQKMDPVARP